MKAPGIELNILPMFSVVICLGIVGGILIKGGKYSGLMAAFAYCVIWNITMGLKIWVFPWSLPALVIHLLIPFVGGYVYVKFNSRYKAKEPDVLYD